MLKICASAKVNLCLDILEKSPSGYHKIQTVLHELQSLKDDLEISETKEYDNVSIKKPSPNQLIKMENNLAFKALSLFKKTYKIQKNFHITIEKNIPIAAGLGGGSSNAAAVLKGLSQLLKMDIEPGDLQKLAEKLGMDVPFFITGGSAFAENFGEKITSLKTFSINVELLPQSSWPKLTTANKTAEMYAQINLSKCRKNTRKTQEILAGHITEQTLHNDFETLLKIPPKTHLSGSGGALFKVL